MAKHKTKYVVTNLRNGEDYETFAVSSEDAINNIHYKLWFRSGIWTEMSDFNAIPESVIELRRLKAECKPKVSEPKYHQMTLFEVSYDS